MSEYKFKIGQRVRVKYSDIEGHVVHREIKSTGKIYNVLFRTPYHHKPVEQLFFEFDLEASEEDNKLDSDTTYMLKGFGVILLSLVILIVFRWLFG